jgi:Na+/H+ antiporter NhaC
MRYFQLLGFQHIVLFFFPTLILMILLYIAFSRTHLKNHDAEEKENAVEHSYPEGIEARNAPFPLILILIIIGFLLWSFFYILGHGLLGVKI